MIELSSYEKYIDALKAEGSEFSLKQAGIIEMLIKQVKKDREEITHLRKALHQEKNGCCSHECKIGCPRKRR